MIRFKSELARNRWHLVHRQVRDAVYDISEFIYKRYGIDIFVTETYTTILEDENIGRKEACHREGRAVDIRTRDWPEGAVEVVKDEFEYLEEELGALSSKDHKRRFIVDVPHGTGPHLHLQIGRDKIWK